MSQSSSSNHDELYNEKLWKISDKKAQKNGLHKSIYWVRKSRPEEDGRVKGEKWSSSCRYQGEWVENRRDGYGVMHYEQGDKYEGDWKGNKRCGHGTLWKLVSKIGNKYKRVYTGDWENDKMSGRGTYFYENDDRYDGFWLADKKHGQGRMIYSNGEIYEGQWVDDMKDGYGTLTNPNGDHFEGYWMRDMKHGQGSYYYGEKNKIYVGEWVEDVPRCGVFTEVEDEDVIKRQAPRYFTDPYELPPIPGLELANADVILRSAIEDARKLASEVEENVTYS